MTITEAIREVLKQNENYMSVQQIYDSIVRQNLYCFKAKKPMEVVKSELRSHCVGVDFPSARPVKWFAFLQDSDGNVTYYLADKASNVTQTDVETELKEMLPDEKMKSAYEEHVNEIKQLLIEKVASAEPGFFEHVVVSLLLKMGYGYDAQAGVVTGASHDGGIDGIIYEDKLGLDKIYIQAKRYTQTNKVGRPVLQAFIGAMQDANKGVFITTSSFTREAKNYIDSQQQKRVKLIDGNTLVDLMIKNAIGVNPIANFCVYQIDDNYFCD